MRTRTRREDATVKNTVESEGMGGEYFSLFFRLSVKFYVYSMAHFDRILSLLSCAGGEGY